MKTVTTTREYDDQNRLVHETTVVAEAGHADVTTSEHRYGATFGTSPVTDPKD